MKISPSDSIAKAAIIVASAAILSKVLGFVRDVVIASKFGTSIKTDAFLVALAFPEFFTDVLAGGALTSAFIPVFAYYLAKNDYEEAGKVFSTIFNLLIFSLSVIVVLGMLNAERVLGFIAPGFSAESLNLAVKISYIIFPAMLFMGLASYLGGVLNATKHFLLPSLNPALLNISIILSAVYFTAKWDIRSLAIGFIAGGILQFLILIPPTLKRKFKYTFTLFINHKGIKKIKTMWIPLLITLCFSNAVSLIVKMFASTLPEGRIAALHFAYRLKHLPIVIFGVTLATAIFPYISWQVAQGDMDKFKSSITRAFKMIFFVTFPLCLGMAVFKVPVVRIIFERGSFTGASTLLTASALLCYLPGAIAVSLSYVAIRAYYALKDPITPLKATVLGLIVMIIFGGFLKNFYSHNGLALAQSLAEILIFLFLFLFLVYEKKILDLYSFIISCLRISFISLMAIIPAKFLFNFIKGFLNYDLIHYQIITLGTAVVFSAGLFVFMIFVLNVEEGKYFVKTVREKLIK